MDSVEQQQPSTDFWPLADGALDTLGCVFQALGADSFQLDSDIDPDQFAALCKQIVQHIENGSAAPGVEIDRADEGTRNWRKVRRFYVDRRKKETSFVSDRLQDYRGVVADLVTGLRQICAQSDNTELLVNQSLTAIATAIDNGPLPDVKRALNEAIIDVGSAFKAQKQEYEQQISALNDRMSGLREDLATAHEEMKLDALTNVYNRRAFDSSIERFLSMHFLVHQPVSIVMIDVDNFKLVNDTLGHTAGDEALKVIAACLTRSFIRKNDLVARYGGDEFVVILPDTSVDDTQASIGRFLDSVQKIEFEVLPDGEKITCTAGCTEIQDDDTVDTLIARADAALYEAKQAGRNCYRIRE